MSEKQTKIKKLQIELQVKDKVISGLVHIIAENNVKIPDALVNVIAQLYPKKEQENVRNTNN